MDSISHLYRTVLQPEFLCHQSSGYLWEVSKSNYTSTSWSGIRCHAYRNTIWYRCHRYCFFLSMHCIILHFVRYIQEGIIIGSVDVFSIHNDVTALFHDLHLVKCSNLWLNWNMYWHRYLNCWHFSSNLRINTTNYISRTTRNSGFFTCVWI